MREEIANVGNEITGSELIALLLESDEIKKHKPFYNSAQKRTSFVWGVNAFYNIEGYLCFEVVKQGHNGSVSFASKVEATNYIELLVGKYDLCSKLCGIQKTESHCFGYMLKKCNGACVAKEDTATYNSKVEMALQDFRYEDDDFVIIEPGRNEDEKGVVLIQDGKYQGFGYLDQSIGSNSVNDLINCIESRQENKDVRNIIQAYLRKNPSVRRIKIEVANKE